MGWLKVKEWWTELPDTLKDRLRAMGFGDFMSIVAFRPDRSLISALSERWRDETHSFHFPTGEMTITLEDIARCWGLKVSGLPVSTGAADANPELVRPLLHRLFGARPYLGSSQIDIEWLWEAYGPARAKISDSGYFTFVLVFSVCLFFYSLSSSYAIQGGLVIKRSFWPDMRHRWQPLGIH